MLISTLVVYASANLDSAQYSNNKNTCRALRLLICRNYSLAQCDTLCNSRIFFDEDCQERNCLDTKQTIPTSEMRRLIWEKNELQKFWQGWTEPHKSQAQHWWGRGGGDLQQQTHSFQALGATHCFWNKISWPKLKMGRGSGQRTFQSA